MTLNFVPHFLLSTRGKRLAVVISIWLWGDFVVHKDLYRQCPSGSTSYIVQSGDTLYKIAVRFGTTTSEILAANTDIIPEQLQVGQVICVPIQPQVEASPCPIGTSPYEIKRGDTLAAIATRFNTNVESILVANPGIIPERLNIGQVICIPQEKTVQPACPMLNTYVVKKGDTLFAISRQFNLPLQSILNANPGIVPEALQVGQVICLPVLNSKLSIIVSIAEKRLFLYSNSTLLKVYPVATGKPETPTPTGVFTIVNKQVNPGGPFGTRWMGLSEPHYGIHGNNNPASIGTAASNGCVRMYNNDVEDLFDMVNVGTVVRIF